MFITMDYFCIYCEWLHLPLQLDQLTRPLPPYLTCRNREDKFYTNENDFCLHAQWVDIIRGTTNNNLLDSKFPLFFIHNHMTTCILWIELWIILTTFSVFLRIWNCHIKKLFMQ